MMDRYMLSARLGWQGRRFEKGGWPPPQWVETLDISQWLMGRIDKPRCFVNYCEGLLAAGWPIHLELQDPRITKKHFWRINAVCMTVERVPVHHIADSFDAPPRAYHREFLPCTMVAIIGGPKKIADVFSRHLSMTVALGVATPEARKTAIRTKVRPIMLE